MHFGRTQGAPQGLLSPFRVLTINPFTQHQPNHANPLNPSLNTRQIVQRLVKLIRSIHMNQRIIPAGIDAKVHLIINKTIDPKGMSIFMTFTEIGSGVFRFSSSVLSW